MKVAVFGGSFNPPHIAHVLACTMLLSLEDVDQVLVVPTYKHPFAKSLAPFEERVHMCELAMGWLPGVAVSRVEEQIEGESLTLRTLQHLAAAHPDWSLRLVVGADILVEAPRWFGFDEIERLAPLIVLPRGGVSAPDGTSPASPGRGRNLGAGSVLLPDVSSTQVRAAAARGDWSEIEKVVPRAVLAHMRSRGLY